MIAYQILSLFFGLIIGSFLNAVIYRIPVKKSIADGRSKCPNCDKLIYWYENLPVVSYAFLRGKCSKCGWKIPWTYPAVELVVGLFAMASTPRGLDPHSLFTYFVGVAIFASFVAIFVIDLKHKIIPNSINIYLAIMFFISVVMNKSYEHWLLGAAIGIIFPLSVTYFFYLLKGQIGLGGGDIKLYGALGIYLGPLGVIQNIFLSCFLGAFVMLSLIVTKVVERNTPLPFGPFIVVVATFQIFLPKQAHIITNFINSFFG